MMTTVNQAAAVESNLAAAFRALQLAVLEQESKEKAGAHPFSACQISSKSSDKTSSSEKNENILLEFMLQAGEPITWVETRELWNDMLKTNNGELPRFQETFRRLSMIEIKGDDFIENVEENLDVTKAMVDHSSQEGVKGGDFAENFEIYLEGGADLAKAIIDHSWKEEAMIRFAKGIKETYSIRMSDDKSELKFVAGALTFLWLVVVILAFVGKFDPNNTLVGRLTWTVFAEAFILFVLELSWECFLSWMVLRYNIKINYARKLGNLFKVPKYFLADFLPFYESTSMSLATSLAINQTLFCLMYLRKSREQIPFFSYVFLSQDRREDRPDTLIFQVTEDIMRFAVYFPFKMLVVKRIGFPAILFIPIAVKNIGDGLAEPVGVAWGRHKYTTKALYYKGKFWNGNFTRSLEGSACVFITTVVAMAVNVSSFTAMQFWITICILPFLMTIAEAKAPHTNDGPFLALIGCGFLSAIFLCVK